MSEGQGAASGATNGAEPAEGPRAGDFQRLWFALERSAWSSLVLVPADAEGSTEEIARTLAEVGKRLSDVPVTAVVASALEYGTAVALADLPQFVDRKRLPPASRWPTVDVEATPTDPPRGEPAADPLAGAEHGGGNGDIMVSSGARIIISIPAVVSQPLGLATTQRADLIVLCIEVGKTRKAHARRTIELIGRERVAGCFLVR
jgi:hypothetical protein